MRIILARDKNRLVIGIEVQKVLNTKSTNHANGKTELKQVKQGVEGKWLENCFMSNRSGFTPS